MSGFVDQYQAALALGILALTVVGFLIERLPPSATAVLGVAAFLTLGLIDVNDLTGAVSNTAPLTIAAMFVLSGALVRTGVLEATGRWVMVKARHAPVRAYVAVIIGTIFASAFMNNTPVVMVLIPLMIRLAASANWAPTRVLIPLSYAAILGGTCTLIGTSTNLLVAGVAEQHGMQPFSIFEITPVGIVTAGVGVAAVFLFSRFLLPDRSHSADVLNDEDDVTFFSELTVAADAPFIGARIEDVPVLTHPGIRVMAIRRGGREMRANLDELSIEGGDRIVIMATMAELLTLRTEPDLEIAGTASLSLVKGAKHRITVEAIVAPGRGGPIGTVKDLRLRRFGVQILGVHRHLHIPGPNLNAIRLRAADRVLLEGSPEGLAAAAEENNLINISTPRAQSYRRRKAPIAIAALAGVVALSALGVMPILPLAVLAIAVILLLHCVDADEAWHAIDGSVLVLIFAMLVIGAGLEKTGALMLVVDAIAPVLAAAPAFMILLAVYAMANMMTEFITNNAVAVVFTPVVIGLADGLGADARPLVIAVMFGASASFATPIGYQTNTMVYGAGHYRFTDFLRIGLPMALVAGLVTCTTLSVLMPLR